MQFVLKNILENSKINTHRF